MPQLDLDDAILPLLRDTLDAVARELGVTEVSEEQEERCLGVLLSAFRIGQRDTIAAVVSDGISMGFARQTGATPVQATNEEAPAPSQGRGRSGPFGALNDDGTASVSLPSKP